MRCFVVCLFPKNEEKKQENRVNGKKRSFISLKKHIHIQQHIWSGLVTGLVSEKFRQIHLKSENTLTLMA